MGNKRQEKCPKCGSDDVKIIEDEFGRCNACGAKFILPEIKLPVCGKCGSANVKIIDGEFLRCLDCGAKMILGESEDETDSQETEKKEEDKKADFIAANAEKNPVSVNCDNCGSSDVDIISDEMARCKHCGATILLHSKDISPSYMTNEYHIHTDNAQESVGYYAIESYYNQEEFVRDAMVYMSYPANVPVEVVDSDITPVRTEYVSILGVNADVAVNYSATIGYDRTEEYEEWDNYKREYVKKTRTVTDWKPFSGSTSSNYSYYESLDDINELPNTLPLGATVHYTVNDVFKNGLNSIDKGAICKYEDATFKKGDLGKFDEVDVNQIKNKCIQKCARNVSLPGDKQKDFSYNGIATVKQIREYSTSVYTMNYICKDGTTHSVNSFGFNSALWGQRVTDSARIDLKVEESLNVFSFIIMIILSLSLIFPFLSFFVFRNYLAAIILFAIAVIFYVVYRILWNIKTKKVIDDYQSIKIERLQDIFRSKGWEELSQNEIDAFYKRVKV